MMFIFSFSEKKSFVERLDSFLLTSFDHNSSFFEVKYFLFENSFGIRARTYMYFSSDDRTR